MYTEISLCYVSTKAPTIYMCVVYFWVVTMISGIDLTGHH